MIKNITVLDVQGNLIGMTYSKRAKGLVKSGRAYFVDGKTIHLVCPSEKSVSKRQEDINMMLSNESDRDMSEIIRQKVEKNIQQEIEETLIEAATEQEKAVLSESKIEETSKPIEIAAESKVENASEKIKKFVDAEVSLKDILHSLNAIYEDKGYIEKALDDLEKLPVIGNMENGAPPDLAGQARAEAIADIVKCRETTNQMMIKLYTQIYTDYMG